MFSDLKTNKGHIFQDLFTSDINKKNNFQRRDEKRYIVVSDHF